MLLVSGGFLGEFNKVYQVQVKGVEFYGSIREIPKQDGFWVFSYTLSSETLDLKIKKSAYPPIIFVKVDKMVEWEYEPKPVSLKPLGFSLEKNCYLQSIKQVKKHIEEGTIYQINLSTKIDFALDGEPIDLFHVFFRRQPTPYAFFLEIEDFFLMSGSMELFLEKKGRKITSKPIKGTGKDCEALKKSSKDRAENLMILDMMRNDLSKISEVGSVEVEELFKVESYSTVCQMHSTVSAKTDADFLEILLNTFPPASVTGAPKRKAVEIIDSLEPHSRDYYCGCAGFRWGDDFTLSVLIRTAFGSREKLSYFAGSGIVYDSEEEKEWEETLSKVFAFYSFSSY
ncbi:chorismate-binding protein [Thermocrinis sp.]